MNTNPANPQKPMYTTNISTSHSSRYFYYFHVVFLFLNSVLSMNRGGFYRTPLSAMKSSKVPSPGIGRGVNTGNAQTPHRPGGIIPNRVGGSGGGVPLKIESNSDSTRKVTVVQQQQNMTRVIPRNPIVVPQHKTHQEEKAQPQVYRQVTLSSTPPPPPPPPQPQQQQKQLSINSSTSLSSISMTDSTSTDSLTSNDSLKGENERLKGLISTKESTINNLRVKISINEKEHNTKIQDRDKTISDLREEIRLLKKSILANKQHNPSLTSYQPQCSSQSIISTQSSGSSSSQTRTNFLVNTKNICTITLSFFSLSLSLSLSPS